MIDFWLRQARKPHSRFARLAVLIGGAIAFWLVTPVVLVALGTLLDMWLGLPVFSSPLWMGVGVLVAALGFSLGAWVAYLHYRRGQGTPSPFVPTQALLVDGPYARSRNPMYLGVLAYYFGVALGVGSPSMVGMVLLITLAVHVYIVAVEERELEARFGEAYREYKRRVPRWLMRWNRG